MFFKVYFIVLYPKQVKVIKIEISIFIKNNVKELILTNNKNMLKEPINAPKNIFFILTYLLKIRDVARSCKKSKKKFKNKADEDDCFDEMVKEQEKLFRSKEFREENSEYFTYEDIINLHLKGDKSIFTYQNEVELIFDGHDKFKEITTEDYKNMSNGEPIIIDVKGIVENPTWRL